MMSEAWPEAFADKLGIDPGAVRATAKDRIAQAHAQEDRETGRHPKTAG